jgi:hypothetical protein
MRPDARVGLGSPVTPRDLAGAWSFASARAGAVVVPRLLETGQVVHFEVGLPARDPIRC